eukprot:scpid66300/ scgid26736/ 
MAFRKPRFSRNPLAHFKTREDKAAYRERFGSEALFNMRTSLKSARTVEIDNYLTKHHWKVIWRSFWRPLKIWALNKQALKYYAVVASLGLGCAYARGLRPDLFGLAPRQHFVPPDTVQEDFMQLKRDLGLEDSRIRLVISRDFASNKFDRFTEPFVYGSPLMPRGATICLPAVFFEGLDTDSDAPATLSSLQVGKATFDWDTVNAEIVKRKLQLPRDELRFVMGTGIVEASQHMPLKRCLKAPFLYIAGIFTYYGVFWSGLEHVNPAVYRAKFRRREAIWTIVQVAVLLRMLIRQRWSHVAACEESVVEAIPCLAESGANYLDRIAIVRTIVRNQLGHYSTRWITDLGERSYYDWDIIRGPPTSYHLLNRADVLREYAVGKAEENVIASPAAAT